jgi:hypothetical protein
MSKIVEVSNDVESGFYLDGKLVFQGERDEFEFLLRKLGYEYAFEENYALEGKFPEDLDDALED